MNGELLIRVLDLVILVIAARVVADWTIGRRRAGWAPKVVRALHIVTEPILRPARQVLRRFNHGRARRLDMSPLLIILAACFLQPLALTL